MKKFRDKGIFLGMRARARACVCVCVYASEHACLRICVYVYLLMHLLYIGHD